MINKLKFQQDLSNREITAAISLGFMAGITDNVKFGYASSIAALGDVWPGGTLYVFPVSVGQPVEIISSDIADAGLEVTVVAINKATGLETSQTVFLDATNPVTTPVLVPGGDVIAVNRAFNANGTAFAGAISIRGTGAPNATVFATILAEDQQTTQTPYMVPFDKVALINNYSTAINKSGGADVSAIMRLVVTRDGKVARTQIRYGLQRSGVSNISSDLVVPIPVPPLAKIQVTALPSAVADISGEYSMQLIDKNLLAPEVLAAIISG